ncbi:hypothetical protein Taro_049618, partial [Colocasia esculenta]|nr:hypothetical protein [Colocasia esculenta]
YQRSICISLSPSSRPSRTHICTRQQQHLAQPHSSALLPHTHTLRMHRFQCTPSAAPQLCCAHLTSRQGSAPSHIRPAFKCLPPTSSAAQSSKCFHYEPEAALNRMHITQPASSFFVKLPLGSGGEDKKRIYACLNPILTLLVLARNNIFCKGSVDTTILGVDTMVQNKGRNVKKSSSQVDTSPEQVDTEPSQVDTTWDQVDTEPSQVNTRDLSQGLVLPVWDNVSTHLLGRSTHSGISVT